MSDFETRWRALISGETKSPWATPARGGLHLLSLLYSGIVHGYRLGYDLHLLRTQRLPCPVISIGNITVGGTGKTTTVRWLARRLAEWGLRPAVLSYGYRAGGTRGDKNAVVPVSGPEGVREPVEVSGDEAQLLARSLPGVPVLIGKRRIRSGRRASEEFQPDACLLDDAFQYWRLEKDLEIVLINATNPFGYGRLVPRGMLREGLRGLRRAHAVIITHAAWEDATARERLKGELRRWNPSLVIAEARHRPERLLDARSGEDAPLETLRGGRWAALSSLGQPESFERTLEDLGAGEVIPARFPDHHPYTEENVRLVCNRVEGGGWSGIVTTEKDWVKIPPGWFGQTPVWVLGVDLQFLSGQDAFESLVRSRLRR